MKPAPFLFLALLACLFAGISGCQTIKPQFPAPGANWRTSIGQLQYATSKRSVIGETVVSRLGANDFQLDFTAGPGLPLMKLRESGTFAHAEGVFAHGAWQGDPSHAPGSLARWVRLREAFATIEAARPAGHVGPVSAVSPAGRLAWTARASGGQPERITIQFPASHERFVFVFSK